MPHILYLPQIRCIDMYTVQLLFCQCIQLILEQLVCHAVS